MNQNQFDIQQLEKETIILAANILEEKCNIHFNLFSLLKFFNGFYLNSTDIENCVDTLELINSYITKYKRYLEYQNDVQIYTLEDKYVNLFNKITVKFLFNAVFLNINTFISHSLITESISLDILLDKISYVLRRRTFIAINEVNILNKKYLTTIGEHLPVISVFTHGLSYPNKIGILSDFSTAEKLGAHFMTN